MFNTSVPCKPLAWPCMWQARALLQRRLAKLQHCDSPRAQLGFQAGQIDEDTWTHDIIKRRSRSESLCLLVRTRSGNHIENVARESRNSRIPFCISLLSIHV